MLYFTKVFNKYHSGRKITSPYMRRNPLKYLILGILLFFCLNPAFAQSISAEYLCEIGIVYYNKGNYDNALSEFKKALLVDPQNKRAKKYISDIFIKETPRIPKKEISREEMMNAALSNYGGDKTVFQKGRKKMPFEAAGVEITGEAQVRIGVSSADVLWKRANWDLNEKNYRILSTTAFDRKENSYDPRIYDRMKVDLDSGNKEDGFGFHSNITVDPWSFTGKSSKFTISGAGGDAAQIELKYWSNTGYTINESINTMMNGDSFALPEIKVVDEKISVPSSVRSAYNNAFTLPETKIYREFQPLREIWVDYNRDNLKLRVYPIAYENQALTFDDPMKLSNNRIWWEDSPWLHGWKPGNFNSGANPVDFTKGYWDNSLSFFTRDSQGQRLTALRGFSFQFNPLDTTSIETSVASPKNLWQDYSTIDNFLSATRVRHSVMENCMLGLTVNTRIGYNTDTHKRDAENYVLGTDLGYEIVDGLKANFEAAYSKSNYDITNTTYKRGLNGNAYHVSLVGRFPFQSIMSTDYGYEGIQPEEGETNFTKFRFFAGRMDKNFDNSLSSYVETRDDEWWSRHLHFRKPFEHYYQGEGQLFGWDDIKSYAVGNGIDYDRSVLGLRVESSLWDNTVFNLFDVRNVHNTKNKFIENVARDELTWSITDRLTSKFLGIYQKLPKTKAGFDPFIFDPVSRKYFTNDQIQDGLDPSITTGSAGFEYEFFNWLALNGIWECTNDVSLAYDNFPRGIFNTASRSFISISENNLLYRDILNSLYSQQFFPKPPYPYYNIFKAGLKLKPLGTVDIYLDYTRNPFEKAGQVDDNMNHVGLGLNYTPFEKFSMFLKYTYSRWQDLDRLQQGITKLYSHNNFFAEFIYRKSQDEDLTFQYGEASRDPYMGGVLDIGWDPYGGSLRTIDTQHTFRLYYRRKF